MKVFPEVIVIGSGVGGAMTARRLAENGVNVLMLERGDWVPKEPDNWRVASVFFDKKYTAHDTSGCPWRSVSPEHLLQRGRLHQVLRWFDDPLPRARF